ncbi:MAG: PaaI family thioesterase [Pseudomonadota bacterium]
MEQAPVIDIEIMRQVADIQTFTNWSGLEVVSCARGRVEIALPFRREDMAQHHGFLHGGLTGFLVDTACAYAAGTVVGDVVTAQYSLHYLSPGVGDRFSAVGEVVKTSKRQVVVDAKVFAEKQGAKKLIAKGSAVIFPAGEANSETTAKAIGGA